MSNCNCVRFQRFNSVHCSDRVLPTLVLLRQGGERHVNAIALASLGDDAATGKTIVIGGAVVVLATTTLIYNICDRWGR